MKKKVSIIMAVCNGAFYLREAINSILDQTYPDLELIIVNDGSTDSSAEIISEYLLDKRITAINNERNIGLTRSLNKAIDLSCGEYIARMDCDDVSSPDRLLKQVLFLDNNSVFAAVGAFAREIDENGRLIRDIAYPVSAEEIKKELIKYNPIIHSSVMFRRGALIEVGKYDDSYRYAQDYDLYFRLVKKFKLANLSDQLLLSRYTSNSLTSKKNRKQLYFSIKARIKAILSGTYSVACLVYLWRPLVSLILPISTRRLIRKLAS
jgi:cellulose synthase/poly-beta-1,6-N-acetylglucosamine synthase-like glycosyltransferase